VEEGATCEVLKRSNVRKPVRGITEEKKVDSIAEKERRVSLKAQ